MSIANTEQVIEYTKMVIIFEIHTVAKYEIILILCVILTYLENKLT